jgi:hypothetical protein
VPAECKSTSPSLASYEIGGFGKSSIWFSAAVIYVPWEGSASITPRELLDAPQPLLSAITVSDAPAADCPQTQRFNDAVQKNRISQISGRGRLRDDGIFVVECVCAVNRLDHLSEDQIGRLYAGPRPR